MNRVIRSPRIPPPSKARSNRDWVMIVLGIALVALFVAAGYTGLNSPERGHRRLQGPVKDPGHVGRLNDLNEGRAPDGAHRR